MAGQGEKARRSGGTQAGRPGQARAIGDQADDDDDRMMIDTPMVRG